jgi:hypothetical protein
MIREKKKKLPLYIKVPLFIICILIITYLVLLFPEEAPPPPKISTKTPFTWNQDAVWAELEKKFNDAKALGCVTLKPKIDSSFKVLAHLLDTTTYRPLPYNAPEFTAIENGFFNLAPMIAACDVRLADFLELQNHIRRVIKKQSKRWDLGSDNVRDRLYRMLYGSRAAVEEVLLQFPKEKVPVVLRGVDEPSYTPMGTIGDLKVRSGDILISRGGAPTSALIARGNDYPGNFSHVALVYVEPDSNKVLIIESHIERGVAISTPDEYLKDTKLRIMVLRPRYDLKEMFEDPMLPHKAASYALYYINTGHVPYDFELNYNDSTKLFCSEVASYGYRNTGINLWMGLSHISSPGLASWLNALGVRHFQTQEPSDLEYDPQLSVVAEWRGPETLFKDHLDNAVIDVMLERAEKGDELGFKWYMLPFARALKLYSVILNQYGKVGPVPEGMSATTALRADEFTKRHDRMKEELVKKADEFKKTKGYSPPYWELLKMAREIN